MKRKEKEGKAVILGSVEIEEKKEMGKAVILGREESKER